MRRRLALAFAALGLLAGCGGSSGDDGEPLRLLVFGDPEELQAYRAVADAYAKTDPPRTVELVEASDRTDLIARLSTSIAGGNPPDLFLMNYRSYGQFAARDAIAPMTERLESSDAFEPGDFYEEALDAFRWRGEQLCLPQNISSLVVYYNRALFRQEGVEEPPDDWTWQEFVATANRLTLDANGNPVAAADPELAPTGAKAEIFGLGVEPSIIRVAPFVWSNGGELVDDDERPTRFTLDTPQAKDALSEFFALRSTYGVVPSDVEVEAEDDEARFANGRLAMLLSSRRSTPTFRAVEELDWDVAPLPRFREQAGILHSDAYCITAGSEHQDDAWAFVEFALGPEGARIVAETGRTVPSLRDVATSEAFLDPAEKPSRARVFLDGIPTIRRVPSISTWPEIEDVSAGILENGMYLGQPVEEVVAELDRATRPLFARGEAP